MLDARKVEKLASAKSQCTLPPLQTNADLHRLLSLLTAGRLASEKSHAAALRALGRNKKKAQGVTVDPNIYNSMWMRMHMLWTSCRGEFEVSKETIRFLKVGECLSVNDHGDPRR